MQVESLTESLTIRCGVEQDAEALRQIGEASYRDHFSHLWTQDGIQRFLHSDFSTDVLRSTLAVPGKHQWLIASGPNREVVGYAKINWSVPDPVLGLVGAELQKIYFLKSAAGKGYGAALLKYILDCAKERSCRRIWLDVLKSNVGAQRFYERMGFRVVGEIPFKTDRAEIGMVVMIRDLDSVP